MKLTSALVVNLCLGFSQIYSALPSGVEFQPIYEHSHFSFDQPTWVEGIPGHPDHLLVIERAGQVYSLVNNGSSYDKTLLMQVDANTNTHWDGAWAIAFHPDYADNRLFYILYREKVNDTRSVIEEWRMDESGVANPQKVRDIIDFEQREIHSSGDIAFGPDGYLYSAQGDKTLGGLDMGNLAGKVIRIDVDNPSGGRPYGIPSDNPFVGMGGAREEIWASGFRVPYRFNFDPLDGTLLLGDVGNTLHDEVNLVEPGKNYGWDRYEGPCTASDCSAYTDALLTFETGEARCIIAGEVYRNTEDSEFYGVYIMGDWQIKELWGMRFDAASGQVIEYASLIDNMPGQISSIGTDAKGRFFAAMYTELGTISERATHIYQIVHPELKEIPAPSSSVQRGFEFASPDPRAFSGQRVFSLQGQRLGGKGLGEGVYFVKDPESGLTKRVLRLSR